MENIQINDDVEIGWEDVLNFLDKKRKLVTKFEMGFNKRKRELDVGL